MSHVMKTPVLPCANNKSADHPVHLRNLISAFIVSCLDSILNNYVLEDFRNASPRLKP